MQPTGNVAAMTFTKDDLMATAKVNTPSWYELIVTGVTSGPGKSDPAATTWRVRFSIENGPFKGAEASAILSTNMMSRAIDYVACFVDNPEPGVSYPPEATIGQRVQGFVKYNAQYNNNAVEAFRKTGSTD